MPTDALWATYFTQYGKATSATLERKAAADFALKLTGPWATYFAQLGKATTVAMERKAAADFAKVLAPPATPPVTPPVTPPPVTSTGWLEELWPL